MKSYAWIVLSLNLLAITSFGATEPMTDRDEIDACLSQWKNHPFKGKENSFRTTSPRVKVMGIGGDVNETAKTDEPELVLVKPAVSVMSSSTMNLLNPNGWYCLKNRVDVMSKSEINLNCKAHLASSREGAVVLGSNETDDGVTVMGSSSVKRVGCDPNAKQ